MLFDWLVLRQVVETNPAAAVRGPKHVVKRGKTPVLAPDQARAPTAAQKPLTPEAPIAPDVRAG